MLCRNVTHVGYAAWVVYICLQTALHAMEIHTEARSVNVHKSFRMNAVCVCSRFDIFL
jgi:hypothetical protein